MRMELTVADTIIQRLPGSTSSATETRPSFIEMDSVVLDSVTKQFRHRPALFNWLSRERSGEPLALVDVSLRVQRGKVLVLLGPNGSGKTTTLKLISTMLLPDSGRVLIEGADTCLRAGTVRKHVGFAVANEPSVILLDEPTRSLDPASTSCFWNLVRELADQGATVILTTHSFQEAVAVGDFVALLHCGRLAAYQKIRNIEVEELRSFYFQTTGELNHIDEFAVRNCR